MKNQLLKVMMLLVAAFVMSAPAYAHCGKCDMDKGHDKQCSMGKEAKDCAADCDKACCKHKKDAMCDRHGKVDCCAHKHVHGDAKQNFGPRSRK